MELKLRLPWAESKTCSLAGSYLSWFSQTMNQAEHRGREYATQWGFLSALPQSSAQLEDEQVNQPNQKTKQGAEEIDILELLFHNPQEQPLQLQQIQ